MSEFNDQFFERKLETLKETQDSITGLSAWCLQHRENHKAIVNTWLKVLKKVRLDQRLTLFYLANDVIQYSKRKSLQFVESWGTALQKATTLVRDEKVRSKILRLFKIWNERAIYDEVFLSDLCGLLTTNTKKNTATESAEFQPNVMFKKMKYMETLEDNTNKELLLITESPLNLNDMKNLSNVVKERRVNGLDVDLELEESIVHLKKYMECLQQEVMERASLIDLLDQGESYYQIQKKEAKVVSNAYRNFGSRVKSMKQKLDELAISLPSPIPSPDINAPSPPPDDELDGDTYDPNSLNTTVQYAQYNTNSESYTPTPTKSNTSGNSHEYTPTPFSGGFASFIGSASLPFDINKSLFSSDNKSSEVNSFEPINSTDTNFEGNKIEVIGAARPPSIVPPPSTPPPTNPLHNPSQSSLESILNLLKQPPPQTSSLNYNVTNTAYTPSEPTPTSSTPAYIPTTSNTPYTQNNNSPVESPLPNSQYTSGGSQFPAQYPSTDSSQYTSMPIYPNVSVPPPSTIPMPDTAYPPTNLSIPPPATITNPDSTLYSSNPPYNNVISYTSANSSFNPGNVPDSTLYSSTSNIPASPPQSFPLCAPLTPPPLPPALFDLDEDGRSAPWHLGTGTPKPETPASNPLPAKFPTWDELETPASPLPAVFNPNLPPPITTHVYNDSNNIDCDERTLPFTSPMCKDTDQRHLPNMDYRTHGNLITFPADLMQSNSNANENNGNTMDNTESMDMELSDDEETKAQLKGSLNINANTEPTPKSSQSLPSMLDIDPSLIILGAQEEKLLSSINMEAINSTLAVLGEKTGQTSLQGDEAKPPKKSDDPGEVVSIPIGVGITTIGMDNKPPTATPFVRPHRPFMRIPRGPPFRQHMAPHFDQPSPPFRPRGPFHPRPPYRGGFRPH